MTQADLEHKINTPEILDKIAKLRKLQARRLATYLETDSEIIALISDNKLYENITSLEQQEVVTKYILNYKSP